MCGGYDITLTTTYGGVDKKVDFTVELVDPCSRAVLENDPTPFPDIIVNLTHGTVLIDYPFHVYTDLERQFPSLVCNLEDTVFTT